MHIIQPKHESRYNNAHGIDTHSHGPSTHGFQGGEIFAEFSGEKNRHAARNQKDDEAEEDHDRGTDQLKSRVQETQHGKNDQENDGLGRELLSYIRISKNKLLHEKCKRNEQCKIPENA